MTSSGLPCRRRSMLTPQATCPSLPGASWTGRSSPWQTATSFLNYTSSRFSLISICPLYLKITCVEFESTWTVPISFQLHFSVSRSWLRNTATLRSRRRWRGCGGIWTAPIRGRSSPARAPPSGRSNSPTWMWQSGSNEERKERMEMDECNKNREEWKSSRSLNILLHQRTWKAPGS